MLRVPMRVPDCDEVTSRLSEYLDRDLDANATTRVALHLALCPGCTRVLSELAATVEALHRLTRGRCPRG